MNYIEIWSTKFVKTIHSRLCKPYTPLTYTDIWRCLDIWTDTGVCPHMFTHKWHTRCVALAVPSKGRLDHIEHKQQSFHTDDSLFESLSDEQSDVSLMFLGCFVWQKCRALCQCLCFCDALYILFCKRQPKTNFPLGTVKFKLFWMQSLLWVMFHQVLNLS